MLILVQRENEQYQAHLLQDMFQKQYQLAIKYHFEDTNYGIHLNFLFQNLYKLFFGESNLHQ